MSQATRVPSVVSRFVSSLISGQVPSREVVFDRAARAELNEITMRAEMLDKRGEMLLNAEADAAAWADWAGQANEPNQRLAALLRPHVDLFTGRRLQGEPLVALQEAHKGFVQLGYASSIGDTLDAGDGQAQIEALDHMKAAASHLLRALRAA